MEDQSGVGDDGIPSSALALDVEFALLIGGELT